MQSAINALCSIAVAGQTAGEKSARCLHYRWKAWAWATAHTQSLVAWVSYLDAPWVVFLLLNGSVSSVSVLQIHLLGDSH